MFTRMGPAQSWPGPSIGRINYSIPDSALLPSALLHPDRTCRNLTQMSPTPATSRPRCGIPLVVHHTWLPTDNFHHGKQLTTGHQTAVSKQRHTPVRHALEKRCRNTTSTGIHGIGPSSDVSLATRSAFVLRGRLTLTIGAFPIARSMINRNDITVYRDQQRPERIDNAVRR